MNATLWSFEYFLQKDDFELHSQVEFETGHGNEECLIKLSEPKKIKIGNAKGMKMTENEAGFAKCSAFQRIRAPPPLEE